MLSRGSSVFYDVNRVMSTQTSPTTLSYLDLLDSVYLSFALCEALKSVSYL